jgi:hypothetical protein
MKNVRILMLVVTVLALAALACSIGGGGGQPSDTGAVTPASSEGGGGEVSASPTKEMATPASSEGGGGEVSTPPPTKEMATSAPTPAENDLTLSTLTDGLAMLKSYKSTFVVKFVGKDGQGQPVDGSFETREEFTQEPRAQRIAVTSMGFSQEQADQSGAFEMITIGDTSYMVMQDQDGKRSCISTSSDEATQPEQGLFSPATLGGVSGAKYVKTDTVNGIKTKHYAWKEGGLVGLGFTSAKGDVWVAVDGNYVVKYTAEATGKDMLFGSTAEEGTITVEYNLTEVNGSFQIEPPADCEAPATDIAIMADAKDKSTFGEMVSYTSASAFADVVEFYKTEMPNNGWQPSGEPTEMEGLAMLEFAKDSRKAQVMISYDTDKQTTDVVITTSQE